MDSVETTSRMSAIKLNFAPVLLFKSTKTMVSSFMGTKDILNRVEAGQSGRSGDETVAVI